MSKKPQLSPEARERVRAEARAVMAAVMKGESRPRRPAGRKSRAKAPGEPRNYKPRPPKYNRDEMARLFLSGRTVSEIATQTGAHRGTVSVALTEAGFDPKTRKGGPHRKDTCARGHDMRTHGREIKNGKGGRYCSECKRKRERVS